MTGLPRARLLYWIQGSLCIAITCFAVEIQTLSAADPDAYEKAVATVEQLTRSETISGSYLDMALAASHLIDPDLDDQALRQQIKEMGAVAAKSWVAEQSASRKIQALGHVVFKKYGFKQPPQAAPIISGKGIFDTYALPGVLKGRRGFCEGLSTVYLLVAEEAKLPVSITSLPVHVLCRVELGKKTIYVECLDAGAQRSSDMVVRMNGAKPAAAKSEVYLSAMTKKQFLSLHVNALSYGLIKQPNGPQPLSMKQMVRLAESIEKLDPDHPESLETAAYIHFRAGDLERARTLISHVVQQAQKYGAPGWVMNHYLRMQHKYKTAQPR